MSDVDDIVDSLIRVRRAFLKANLLPPEIIELKNLEQGKRFYRIIDCSLINEMRPMINTIDVGPKEFKAQIEIAGFKIRWPV